MVKYADLVGIPFRYGARGPEAFDCYGLIMEMAKRSGQVLPDFGSAEDQGLIAAMMGTSLPQWREVEPQAGAIVLIRIGRHASHVAFQLDEFKMIHAWGQSSGVSVIKIQEWQHRIVGFYKYVGI